MRTRVSKWGHSLAVRIPKSIIREARLNDGDSVVIDLDDDGTIRLRSNRRKYDLADLVSRIIPANRQDEIDWGTPQGAEKW